LNLSGLYVKMGKIEKIGKLNKPVLKGIQDEKV
jgi:hypothetical protein